LVCSIQMLKSVYVSPGARPGLCYGPISAMWEELFPLSQRVEEIS
jgi:hypothetical protein